MPSPTGSNCTRGSDLSLLAMFTCSRVLETSEWYTFTTGITPVAERPVAESQCAISAGRSIRLLDAHKSNVLRRVLLYVSETTRITEKGQATIPHELREKYDLEPGDEVVWMDTEEGIVVKKRTRTGGRGMLLPDDTSAEAREEIAEELRGRVRDRRDRNYGDS